MRSKRSKAWHRRKDEIARARELIEQGVRPPTSLAEILAESMRIVRERVLFNTLKIANTVPLYVSKSPTIKFRRWPK